MTTRVREKNRNKINPALHFYNEENQSRKVRGGREERKKK